MRSNCYLFALKMYLKHGGYIVLRKSRMGSIFPHALWVRDLKDADLLHFVPTDNTNKLVPPPVFRGFIKSDDL